jgi:hypothetical protein
MPVQSREEIVVQAATPTQTTPRQLLCVADDSAGWLRLTGCVDQQSSPFRRASTGRLQCHDSVAISGQTKDLPTVHRAFGAAPRTPSVLWRYGLVEVAASVVLSVRLRGNWYVPSVNTIRYHFPDVRHQFARASSPPRAMVTGQVTEWRAATGAPRRA